jgi:hypothetical protein
MSKKKVPGTRLGVIVEIKENDDVLYVVSSWFQVMFEKREKDKTIWLQFQQVRSLHLKKGDTADPIARESRINDAFAILRREKYNVLSR